MKIITLTVKEIGTNELLEMRNQLDAFVSNNFDLLFLGAIKLECEIDKDYYAPRRIQIGKTRLHNGQGLKIANGHHMNDNHSITEEQLKNTVLDIQELIDKAAEKIESSFSINIVEN